MMDVLFPDGRYVVTWVAVVLVVAAAIVALKGRPDQPVAQRLESPAMPWDHFRPFVAGPKDVFGGWMPRTRVAEGVLVAIPFPITLQAYDALDSILSLLTATLFYCCSCFSLAPHSPFTPAGVPLPASTSCQRTKTDQRDLGGSMTESPLNLRGVRLSCGPDPEHLFGVTS